MQTFLADKSFRESARVLDNSRLGNQCYRECKTLINGGWENHPASKMWHGYEHALCEYALELAHEMGRRKKPDGSPKWKPQVVARWTNYWSELMDTYPDTGYPPWLGNEQFHSSHRAALLAKNWFWYRQFNWTEEPRIDYTWPKT